MNLVQLLEACSDQESKKGLTRLNSEVCELAWEAGKQIMRFYEAETNVTLKKDAFALDRGRSGVA